MPHKKLIKTLIKQFEGLRLTAYHCSAGVKTIGYGHVITLHEKLRLGDQITLEQAEQLLENDIIHAESILAKYCHAPLTPNQKAALISFIFNCGSAAFKNSTLLKKLNQSEYLGAADEFLRWVYVKGQKLKGLVKRRTIERTVFLSEIKLTP